jgi:hypothetical protein
MGLGVGINDWGITCCWWGRKGVECVDELGVNEETGWGKVDACAYKSLRKDKSCNCMQHQTSSKPKKTFVLH